MIKKTILILLILLLSMVKGYTQTPTRLDTIKNDPYIYPWLSNIFENYYDFHLKLPESPENLISFTKRIEMFMYSPGIDEEVKLITIPKLEKYRNEINFSVKDSVFYVQIKDSIYEDPYLMKKPCNFMSFYEGDTYDLLSFLSRQRGRYFDMNNEPLVCDSLIDLLDTKFKSIKYLEPEKGYEESFVASTYYSRGKPTSNKIPYRIILDYTIENGLQDFCTKDEMPSNNYYNETKRLAHSFCLENNLKRIIWFGFKHK